MDPRAVLTRPAPEPDEQVRYGAAEHQVVDHYAPRPGQPSDPGPAPVVLIHGGFWRAPYDRTHLRPLATALAERGHPVYSLDYPGTGGSVPSGWAVISEAVTASFDAATADHHARSGGGPVVLAGHSAGGQLAVWLAHQPKVAQHLAGVLSLAGCLDLALAEERQLGDGAVAALFADMPGAGTAEGSATRATGAAQRAAADPARLGPCPVPVTALHGMDDLQVPVEVSRSWWQAAAQPDRDRLLTPAEVEHFGLIDPEQSVFATVTEQIDRLAGRTGADAERRSR